MITGSDIQPLIAVAFLVAGAIAYFAYEVLRGLRASLKLPVLTVITDCLYVVGVFLLFIALSHFIFEGRIEYYSLLCFSVGIVTLRITLKPPIRKFLKFISNVYSKLRAKYTKPKITEAINENKDMLSV